MYNGSIVGLKRLFKKTNKQTNSIKIVTVINLGFNVNFDLQSVVKNDDQFSFLSSSNSFRDLPGRDANPRTNFDNFWNAALAVFQVRC